MSKTPYPKSVWTNPIHFLAFGFGSGTSPFAPGTCGTLVAIPLYLLVCHVSLFIYSTILIVMIVAGIWICDETEKVIGEHDYPGIVWDEIAGYFLTMFAVPCSWIWVLLGFILFRFFDIWKPWPVSWIDKHVPGGLGVMIDDLAAAIYAWGCLQVLVLIVKHL